MKNKKLILTILLLCAVFRMIAQPPPPPPPPPPPGGGDSSGCSAQVSITSTSTDACSAITFTAMPVSAGSSAAYVWYKNGVSVGSGLTYSATSLNFNDQVYVKLTAPCGSTPVVTYSNTITITANPNNATVSLNVSNSNLDQRNGNVIFTASTTNAGTNPSYNWYLNGNQIGSYHTAVLSYGGALGNGDQVWATVTATACGATSTVMSNIVTLTKSGSTAKDITFFTMPAQVGNSVINNVTSIVNTTVTTPPAGRTSIHPTRINTSPGSTYGPSFAVNMDFSMPVTYTVVAQDGSRKVWTAIVLDQSGNKTSGADNTVVAASSDALNVFPIPAQNFVIATAKGGADAPVVTVLDMQGRVMYNEKLPVTDKINHLVDVSQYAVGTYIMYVQVGDQRQTQQFTVAK